jgi:hypothetical protein
MIFGDYTLYFGLIKLTYVSQRLHVWIAPGARTLLFQQLHIIPLREHPLAGSSPCGIIPLRDHPLDGLLEACMKA